MNAILTYRFKIKGKRSTKILNSLAPIINQVWNYCNSTSHAAIRNHSKFLSWVDLINLTSGSSKLLGISSESIQAICEQYARRRRQAKKNKLRWRISKGSKKSLGWVPFKSRSIVIKGNTAIYRGFKLNFWNSWDGEKPGSRALIGEIKSGCFSQDSMGDWYLSLNCKDNQVNMNKNLNSKIGIDLGLKTLATLSNGSKIENPRFFKKQQARLARAQRAKKKKLTRNIHKKIKNQRKDFLHKTTTNLAKTYETIYIGNVSAKAMQKKFGKSETDASWGLFRQFLKYKAIRQSGIVRDVSEVSTTITCSSCLAKTGPSGLSGLVIREWECSVCNSIHDRDVNSAINILRLGHQTP